jgi:hypothetical protein
MWCCRILGWPLPRLPQIVKICTWLSAPADPEYKKIYDRILLPIIGTMPMARSSQVCRYGDICGHRANK